MAVYYEVRMEGHVDGRRFEWFEELEVMHLANGETLLRGVLADQAALHGLLAQVRDLNLPLIAVIRKESE